MTPRALRLLGFLAVLLPGTWYAWQWRQMPHASEYHDDGIYFVSAKALAGTGNYTIESLPADPPQTKYPPLWPAVLSIAWRAVPHYPDNLPVAMGLCWLWLPLTLFAYRHWLIAAGVTDDAVLLLGAAWALNPYVVLFSTTMLSEMMFTFLLLAALLCMRPQGLRWAAAAGVLAGLAFLTRTAGVALLPAALLYYVTREHWKGLGLFAAGMLPPALGWIGWSMLNRTPGIDPVTLYYTNYLGHYLANFSWGEAPVYLWKNLDGMLHGLGSLLLPNITQSMLDKVLAESLAIAGVIGVVRLCREKGDSPFRPYIIFSGCYALLLLIWHFPPTERFMLPVAPLWLVGLLTEMRQVAGNIAKVFRKPETGQRIAGGLITALAAGAFLYCGVRQWGLLADGLPAFYADHTSRLRRSVPAMTWIKENLPAEARFLSENDPLLYLRTGRKGVGLEVILPTIDWYREDHAARTAKFAEAAALAKANRLEYLLLNEWDFARDMPAGEHTRLLQALRTDVRLERIFQSGPTAIYRVR